MAWLKLIPWAKLPWKTIGVGVLAAALYFCWQEKQRAEGQAHAWHQVIETVNAAVVQQEKQRVEANKLAADSLRESELARVDAAAKAAIATDKGKKAAGELRQQLQGDQRMKLDSMEWYYQTALAQKDTIIGKLMDEKATVLSRAIRAENSLTDSQRYNGQLQKALLAEQKRGSSKVGHVIGAVGATIGIIALVAK